MIGLFNYYRKKEGEDGEIIFQRVREEEITICGKTIEEVINILKALDIEKIYQLEMTMQNLNEYQKIMDSEQRRLEKLILSNMLKETFKSNKEEK